MLAQPPPPTAYCLTHNIYLPHLKVQYVMNLIENNQKWTESIKAMWRNDVYVLSYGDIEWS